MAAALEGDSSHKREGDLERERARGGEEERD